MITPIDWTAYPNFQPHEFACSHTGRIHMDPEFLALLQQLRTLLGVPLIINSGYRDPTHPREAAKLHPGPHTTGRAADVQARGALAHRILSLALPLGFTGIGVQQRGQGRFLHLDTVAPSIAGPRPFVWSY